MKSSIFIPVTIVLLLKVFQSEGFEFEEHTDEFGVYRYITPREFRDISTMRSKDRPCVNMTPANSQFNVYKCYISENGQEYDKKAEKRIIENYKFYFKSNYNGPRHLIYDENAILGNEQVDHYKMMEDIMRPPRARKDSMPWDQIADYPKEYDQEMMQNYYYSTPGSMDKSINNEFDPMPRHLKPTPQRLPHGPYDVSPFPLIPSQPHYTSNDFSSNHHILGDQQYGNNFYNQPSYLSHLSTHSPGLIPPPLPSVPYSLCHDNSVYLKFTCEPKFEKLPPPYLALYAYHQHLSDLYKKNNNERNLSNGKKESPRSSDKTEVDVEVNIKEEQNASNITDKDDSKGLNVTSPPTTSTAAATITKDETEEDNLDESPAKSAKKRQSGKRYQ